MKIVYDHQIFSSQVYGGISRYFYELLNCFSQDDVIDFKLSLKYSNNYYLKNATFSKHKTFLRRYNFRGKHRLLHFLNKQKSITMLKRQDFDIFHPTYYDPYFLNYLGNKPFILTIHDMIHELYFPMFSPRDKTSEQKKMLALKASKIIAVSENTKKDIVRFYGIDERKIDVVYHGNSLKPELCIKIPNIKLPETYLLYIGNRSIYKNFNKFINAMAPVLKDNMNLNIVCAGGGNFTANEKELFKTLNISKQIHYHSISNDNVLAYLYSKAIAFVYPSLYEGFGIPILEAFSCGCPVVLSNTSSFPEVAGDAAEYFDPNNITSIRESVYKVINDNGLRTELKRRGFEQLKKYSWAKAAKDTLKVYESIL